MLRKLSIAIATTAVLSAGSFVAAAQTQPPASAQVLPAVSDLDAETKRAFAVAYISVAEIAQQNQERLAAAQADPENQQDIMQDVTAQMSAAIEATPGISVEEYVVLQQTAQTDAALAEELNGNIAALVGQSEN